MARQVRGILFVDYVRMLRAQPDRSWEAMLHPNDLPMVEQTIDPSQWYPMDTFERLGLAILKSVAHGQLHRVREWGRTSAAEVAGRVEQLVVPGDPRESLMRFQVFRRTFFDFEALTTLQMSDGAAELQIAYGMSPVAEEAAAVQTVGFFVGLLEVAGATSVRGFFTEESWKGAERTVAGLAWAGART
jgi:hypothetical protein